MKTTTKLIFGFWALVAVLGTMGCTTSKQSSQPRAAAEPAPASTPPPASPGVGCTETTTGLIHLSKTMPPEASLGGEFITTLSLTAQGCAANVVVRDTIPAGASYVRSEPAGTVEGNELIWRIGNMEAGQTINGRVWLKAEREGHLVTCATVSADPRVCGSTFVGQATLAIVKTGPETAMLGSDVTYNIVVRNTGSGVARNIVVTDPVPDGMSGQPVTANVGDLAPGQAKSVPVTFKANQRGKVCNTATATGSNTAKVSAEACTTVLVPGLKVEKSGTKEQILGRNADYEIVVSNTGDTILTNVLVIDTAPPQTTIVSAPGATVNGNTANWTIAELKPGTKQTVLIKLTSRTAGNHCNNVTANSGVMNEFASACTIWKGIAAVLLEAVDDPDPIQVGESTIYTIKVTNQGFADIHNMKIVAIFDEEVTPTGTAHGQITGQTVTFPVVPLLNSKQVTTYTITVKGVKVGDARNKITLTSDELRTPVDEEESTTVY